MDSPGSHRRRLDQGWEMALADAGSEPGQVAQLHWHPAEVPGTAASALRSLDRWDWHSTLDLDAVDGWWRLRFDVAEQASGLRFDGLATLAEVWLDGDPLLASNNMFRGHEVPLTLAPGTHELLIRCRALAPELAHRRPRPRWRVPMLAQQQLRWFRTTLLGRTPGWSPPCAPLGPWRPVWLLHDAPAMDEHPVVSVQLDGDGRGVVQVDARCRDDISEASLVLERGTARHAVALAIESGRVRGTLQLDKPDLWWPHTHGEPALHEAAIEYRDAQGDQRMRLPAIGFRRIEIDRRDGDFAVRVNGIDVFCRGACWTPPDVVSLQADDDQCTAAVAQMCQAGMNMLRIGGTMVYEADSLYEALDRQGVLLWQDLMFANMDYPDDADFQAEVDAEVGQQLERLRARPCLALVCGNSEAEQQAAMAGAPRELWSQALFHDSLAALVREAGIAYVASSATDGAFPHAADQGPTSYFGVGAYLRPLDDARLCGLRFASECLAFANIPSPRGLPGGPAARVHQPLWKTRAPRDLGAGWDFDDVRDHYLRDLYGIDPTALRVHDHARYLALGRVVTGEVMARCFAEWRRRDSTARGALVWFLRDLWPGAGWGLIESDGTPKACWHALQRVLAPRALTISDEGVNGLVIHAFNDRPQTWAARLDLRLYRGGDIVVGEAGRAIEVPAHGELRVPATDLLDGFADLSFAYRFGPAMADVVHVAVHEGEGEGSVAEAFHFPAGLPAHVEPDVGLSAEVEEHDGERVLCVASRAFAQSVQIDAPGLTADDNYFHLAPGQCRRLRLRRQADTGKPVRGHVDALNSERGARFTW